MDEPLKTIGLTEEANAVLAELMNTGVFAEETDIAKLAISHAAARKLHPKRIGKTNTKWAIGNFDPDGSIQQLMGVLYPEEEPTHVMRDLMSQGLLSMADEYRAAGSWDLVALVEPARAT